MLRPILACLLVMACATPTMAAATIAPEGMAAYYDSKSWTADKLIPPGYLKASQANGDLNGDGLEDVVLLLSPLQPASPEAGPNKQTVVLFLGNGQQGFTFWKIGTHHITTADMDAADSNANTGALSIKNGVLTVAASVDGTTGWETAACTSKWRIQHGQFQLIGHTMVSNDRRCACGATVDTNYSTGGRITRTDKSNDGNQLPQEKIIKTKLNLAPVNWESYDYDTLCQSE